MLFIILHKFNLVYLKNIIDSRFSYFLTTWIFSKFSIILIDVSLKEKY